MIGNIAIGVGCTVYVLLGALISIKMAMVDRRRGDSAPVTYVTAFIAWPLTLMTFGALWLDNLERTTR